LLLRGGLDRQVEPDFQLHAVDREGQFVALDLHLRVRALDSTKIAIKQDRLIGRLDCHVPFQHLELRIGGGVLLQVELGYRAANLVEGLLALFLGADILVLLPEMERLTAADVADFGSFS
jgi:hypothetical protein